MEKLKFRLNKVFIIFLLLHILIWSCLPLLREILPIDALECIYWGGLHDFGTNKHPPMAGWIAYYVYNLFGKSDYSIYLLGQLCIAFGFIYIYKLGKIFVGEIKSLISVMLLETCFVYTYMGIYDGFNPNFMLLALLPFLSYYFYICMKNNRIKDWLILGLGFGVSFLSKYQTLMLFVPMLLYLFITKTGREQFRRKGLYIAAIVSFVCLLPHITWLFNHEFLSLDYFSVCEDRYLTFYNSWIKYFQAPFLFLVNQFAAIIGMIFVYFTAKLFVNKPIKFNNINSEDSIYLICVGILPVFLQTIPGLINGAYMIPQWGYTLLFMTPILLFYYFQFDLSERAVKYMLSWVLAAALITAVVLGIVFTTERNFANRLPIQQITKTLTDIYSKETGGKQIKYIGGFIELSIPISLYNNDYVVILNTYNHKNPWIDMNDLKKTGSIVIGRDYDFMDGYIKASAPYLKEKPIIKPFKLAVKSVVGKERTYEMYYAIVPALND